MRKLPADSALGPDLRKRRRGRGLTQGQLAAEAGFAGRTVRLPEQGQGQGNLDSWRSAPDPVGAELVGRNSPAGASPGQRLAKLRGHRGPIAELVASGREWAAGGTGREGADLLEKAVVALLDGIPFSLHRMRARLSSPMIVISGQ